MLKILLQIWIFAILILSSGYQSIVTSFMLNPVRQETLKSVDELLDSNLKILYHAQFEEKQADNPKYQRALIDGRIIELDDYAFTTKKWIKMNLALLRSCEDYTYRIKELGNGISFWGLYLIPEIIMSDPEDMYIRPYHPYIDRFQQIMDHSLEAGLTNVWEKYFYEAQKANLIRFNEIEKKGSDKEVLDFEAIAPFLLILAIGFSMALLIFLIEIFHHDFVSELTGEFFKRRYKKIFTSKIKNRKKKIKVKRIHVRPVVKNQRKK